VLGMYMQCLFLTNKSDPIVHDSKLVLATNTGCYLKYATNCLKVLFIYNNTVAIVCKLQCAAYCTVCLLY